MVFLQRKHERSSRFSLEDANGDDNRLTHFGQSIGDMTEFDSIGLSDEEVEGGKASPFHNIE